jgi:putative glutamine amidotransferase
MQKSRKSSPLIGITCGAGPNLPNYPELYVKAVGKAGGVSFFLPSDSPLPDVAREIDGCIIPGGRDIDPRVYGESPSSGWEPEDPGRVDFEFLLLREIMKKKKPLFGICYGMQLMNVFYGGTLYQDVVTFRKGTTDHRKGEHIVNMEDNPYFRYGRYLVNSNHHQAVKEPGTGIRPFAFSRDGLTEAFYHDRHPFALGVQWHPERMDCPLTDRLFNGFIKACHALK